MLFMISRKSSQSPYINFKNNHTSLSPFTNKNLMINNSKEEVKPSKINVGKNYLNKVLKSTNFSDTMNNTALVSASRGRVVFSKYNQKIKNKQT